MRLRKGSNMKRYWPIAFAVFACLVIAGCIGEGGAGTVTSGGTTSGQFTMKYTVPADGATARIYDGTARRAYITHPSDGTLWIFDNATKTVIAKVAMPATRGANLPHPFAIAPDFANHRVFIANQGIGTLAVLDTTLNTVVG